MSEAKCPEREGGSEQMRGVGKGEKEERGKERERERKIRIESERAQETERSEEQREGERGRGSNEERGAEKECESRMHLTTMSLPSKHQRGSGVMNDRPTSRKSFSDFAETLLIISLQ